MKFLPDPLQPDKPTFFPAERSGHTKTIEEARKEDLETYRASQLDTGDKEEPLKEEPLQLVSEDKEETLDKEESVKHDVAVSEAEAGKIKLSTVIPVKTIRLDLDKFEAFYSKKFYRVKLDYDLYFEVNADNQEECVKKIVSFIKSQLKGMTEVTQDDMQFEEFIPQKRYESEEYDFNG